MDVKITKKNAETEETDFEYFLIEIFTTENTIEIKCKIYKMELFELTENEYKESMV